MKILVLGGRGFLGKHLFDYLQKENYQLEVRSKSDGTDLTIDENVKQCFDILKPDIIFNLAAYGNSLQYEMKHPADVIKINMKMAMNIYENARLYCPEALIINPLPNCTYPSDINIQSEEDWWNGEVHDTVFSYGNAKRFLYVISKNYFRQYKIQTINLIIPNMFGPGDSSDPSRTHALNGMIIRMLRAKNLGVSEFEIWGTGSPIREWIYVKDVANLMCKALNKKVELVDPLNLAQNKGYSIKESAEMIKNKVKFQGSLKFNTDYADGSPSKIMAKDKFDKIFPNFKFTNHEKGISETVKYYSSIL